MSPLGLPLPLRCVTLRCACLPRPWGGDSKRARLQSVLAVVRESSVVDQEARTSFIQHEVPDEQGTLKETGLIGSLDEISEWLALEEIEKLQMLSVFKPVRAVDVPSTALKKERELKEEGAEGVTGRLQQ
eukprot:6132659-Amphidinium_carterae.1